MDILMGVPLLFNYRSIPTCSTTQSVQKLIFRRPLDEDMVNKWT